MQKFNIDINAKRYYNVLVSLYGQCKADRVLAHASQITALACKSYIDLEDMVQGHRNEIANKRKERTKNMMNRGVLINNCYVRPRNGKFEYLEPTGWQKSDSGRVHPSYFRVTETLNSQEHAVAIARANRKHVRVK